MPVFQSTNTITPQFIEWMKRQFPYNHVEVERVHELTLEEFGEAPTISNFEHTLRRLVGAIVSVHYERGHAQRIFEVFFRMLVMTEMNIEGPHEET